MNPLISKPVLRSSRLLVASQRAFATGATKKAAAADVNAYVPGGPVLPGTVNDATSFPAPNKAHGSNHWQFERLLSAGLVPLTLSTFAMSSAAHPILDAVLAGSLIVHTHIGFDACIVDYLHTRKFPVLGAVANWGLRAATLAALWGAYEFNTNDVGMTEVIRQVWTA